jgi:DNA-binding winged helix-turn-helix (wHTH) protein
MSRTLQERAFDLGAWRVEPARGILRAGETGVEVRLEPRLMDLLLLFAASGGRVLSKDDIIAGVWGGRAVGDDTLAAAVSRLRAALGESRDNRYIETVPKRGYRFARDAAAAKASTQNAKDTGRAAQFLQRGEVALRAPFAASLAEARYAFESAIAEEPSLAAAHAGLAETLLSQHLGGGNSAILQSAKTAALAAVGLDASCARAWSVLGMCKLLMDRDFAAADQDLLRAIALESDLITPHLNRAFAFAGVGRFVEAEREARRAVELEPLSLQARNFLLQVLIAARRYQPAINAANEAIAAAPHAAEGWYAKGWAFVFLGNEPAGVDAFMKGLELWGLPRKRLAVLTAIFVEGYALGCAAVADLFEEQGLLFRPRTTDIAIQRAAAHQADLAIAALERALRRDDPYLLFLPWLPHFDSLREDAKFVDLLKRVRPVR